MLCTCTSSIHSETSREAFAKPLRFQVGMSFTIFPWVLDCEVRDMAMPTVNHTPSLGVSPAPTEY